MHRPTQPEKLYLECSIQIWKCKCTEEKEGPNAQAHTDRKVIFREDPNAQAHTIRKSYIQSVVYRYGNVKVQKRRKAHMQWAHTARKSNIQSVVYRYGNENVQKRRPACMGPHNQKKLYQLHKTGLEAYSTHYNTTHSPLHYFYIFILFLSLRISRFKPKTA